LRKKNKKKISTKMGFEPTRAEPIGLAVQRLNHSATSSYLLIVLFKNIHGHSMLELKKKDTVETCYSKAVVNKQTSDRFLGILGICYVFSSYSHHSTIPQPNNFIMDCRIRLLGQNRSKNRSRSILT
jgi:hypothetical protein